MRTPRVLVVRDVGVNGLKREAERHGACGVWRQGEPRAERNEAREAKCDFPRAGSKEKCVRPVACGAVRTGSSPGSEMECMYLNPREGAFPLVGDEDAE